MKKKNTEIIRYVNSLKNEAPAMLSPKKARIMFGSKTNNDKGNAQNNVFLFIIRISLLFLFIDMVILNCEINHIYLFHGYFYQIF